MSNKLTDRPVLNERPDKTDVFHIVDKSDTTDGPNGTSKQIPAEYVGRYHNIPMAFKFCGGIDFSQPSILDEVRQAINALPTFALEFKVYKFFTVRWYLSDAPGGISSGGGPAYHVIVDHYDLKNVYEALGSGGEQLAAPAGSHLQHTSRIRSEVSGLPWEEIPDDQGSDPINSIVDTADAINIIPGGLNLIKVNRGGVDYYYLYVGEARQVGTGSGVSTQASDFLEWPSDGTSDSGEPAEEPNDSANPKADKYFSFACGAENEAPSAGEVFNWTALHPIENIQRVDFSLRSTASTNPLKLIVEINSVDIHTTRPQIDVGQKTTITALADQVLDGLQSIAPGDVFRVTVDSPLPTGAAGLKGCITYKG